ncbi:MAG: hypothetical protein DWH99_00105 [Planctomycetota bacterium]|nr:MAG: hypothetical protein DWH99_00105 [Planctomycetota bacterium]
MELDSPQRREGRKAKPNAVLNRTLFSLPIALGLGELCALAVSLGLFPTVGPSCATVKPIDGWKVVKQA